MIKLHKRVNVICANVIFREAHALIENKIRKLMSRVLNFSSNLPWPSAQNNQLEFYDVSE